MQASEPSRPIHCRYCNARFESNHKRCPTCNRTQGYHLEALALLFIALIVLITIWGVQSNSGSPQPINYSRETTPSPPPQAPQGTSLSQRNTGLTSTSNSTPRSKPKNTSTRTTNTRSYSSYQKTQFKQQSDQSSPFYVAEKKWNSTTGRYDFYRVGMEGSERVMKQDFRRYFLSENQNDYPKSTSGCGPTALLNLYIWYTKFGLLKESIKHSDPNSYKQLKFRQIDRKIAEIQGHSRSPVTGTNSLEQVLAIDEICQASSKTPLRIHFEYTLPPLRNQDFINLSRNYRAGILSVQPKDPRTGRLMNYHAVLAIRGDTDGKITLANWGDFTHGRLIQKSDGQWFIPDDPTQHQLKIVRLTTLIPFTPRA